MNVSLKLKIYCLVSIIGLTPVEVPAKNIIFAISAKTGSLQQLSSKEFTEQVNLKLAKQGIHDRVRLFDNAQLGKDKDLLQKIKLGTVHITLPSSVMSNIAGEYALFDLPFLIKDRQHLARVQDVLMDTVLMPALQKKGYQVLAVWENGFRNITNNKRPINRPSDLKGLKIRTPKSSWRVKMFKQWGANPTPMAFSEVFVGLQTGVIDGQENPLTNIYSAKLNEVQQYLSITRHVYSPSYPLVATKVFTKLSSAIQRILLQTAKEVQYWARNEGSKADKELMDKLVNLGMKVNRANRQSFVKSSASVYQVFSKQIMNGQELIDTALKLSNIN